MPKTSQSRREDRTGTQVLGGKALSGTRQTPSAPLRPRAAGILLAICLITESAVAQPRPAAPACRPVRRIVVSIPDRKLALLEDGVATRVFPVAVGKESTPSPSGSFRIVNRVELPTYYHDGKIVPPGAANPVGTRWIGLNERGYGIHGTNAPKSIGKAASHGCIRMARADLEELFDLVSAGDAVEIRAERNEETAQLFGSTETLVANAGPLAPGTGE